MDGLDVYYIALILNPQYKTRLLEQELGDEGKLIIQNIKEVLHQQYPPISSHLSLLGSTTSTTTSTLILLWQRLEAKLLAKI